MYDRIECLYAANFVKVCVSGNFPETAWRVMNHRQATHLSGLVLWFWGRDRLGAHSRPPGDA